MHSLRWKMIVSTMIVVFIPVFMLNRYAITSFDRFTSGVWEAEMLDTATLCGEIYTSSLPQEEAFSLIQRFSEETDMRIQVLATDARLQFDTHPADPLPDFPALPEVKEAQQGRYMARNRLTEDRKYMYYFGARPVKDANQEVIAIIYISRNTSVIMTAINTMFARQKLATITALLLAACVSAMVAMTLTYRLRCLTRATTAFARGETPTFKHTQQRRDEIGVLSQSFQSMAEEIEERNNYNREFIRTVVHELRTPITAIRGATEVLESDAGNTPEARTRFLANIQHQVGRLTRLVGEMNALTELDLEGPRTPREQHDYVQLLREVVEFLEPAFEEPHARFELDLPDAKLFARVSPGRIEQVIANLLENAFRFTSPEGSVHLNVYAENEQIITEIRDTGSGIHPSNLARVFDRFFTTSSRKSDQPTGSGLGLAICQRIVEAHQGEISVESSEGKGSTFRFCLPLASTT